jgi:hypothetical protein
MLFASAVPLVPGKTDRYRNLGAELAPHLDEYAALNARYDVSQHAFWINHTRTGVDLGVSVYEIGVGGFADMRQRAWDTGSAYDRWWLGFVGDVNGIDLLTEPSHGAAPEPVFAWEG